RHSRVTHWPLASGRARVRARLVFAIRREGIGIPGVLRILFHGAGPCRCGAFDKCSDFNGLEAVAMRKIGLLVCLLGMLSGIAACGSDGGEDLSLAECNYTPHRLDWDEVSPDGTVPEDLLMFAEFTNASLPVTLGTDQVETSDTISFTVSRRGTHALYQEGENCPSRLEVPLLISFSTNQSNTFDEAFEVIAVEQDGTLVVSHIFEQKDLKGDFE